MSYGRLALLTLVAFASLSAQNGPPPKSREIDDLLTKAGQSGAAGDKTAAVGILEIALQKIQKDADLKSRETDVLNRLGRAYLDAQRPADAVRTYRVMLDGMKSECSAESISSAERCAEAQYNMGTAQMYNGQFAAAVVTLNHAVANFALCIKTSGSPEYRASRLKQQADAENLMAAGLFRSGKKDEGIAAFEHAIQDFATVMKDPAAPPGLRDSAAASMKDAQTSLDLLKKN